MYVICYSISIQNSSYIPLKELLLFLRVEPYSKEKKKIKTQQQTHISSAFWKPGKARRLSSDSSDGSYCSNLHKSSMLWKKHYCSASLSYHKHGDSSTGRRRSGRTHLNQWPVLKKIPSAIIKKSTWNKLLRKTIKGSLWKQSKATWGRAHLGHSSEKDRKEQNQALQT